MAGTGTPDVAANDDNTPPGGTSTAPGYGDQGPAGAGGEMEQGAGTEGGTREGEKQPATGASSAE